MHLHIAKGETILKEKTWAFSQKTEVHEVTLEGNFSCILTLLEKYEKEIYHALC